MIPINSPLISLKRSMWVWLRVSILEGTVKDTSGFPMQTQWRILPKEWTGWRNILIIKSAEFVTSAVKPSQYPPAILPEIAFAGRSNVGKSSLINTLVNRKRLVKTSSTPGRTQLINFFNINEAFSFVDIPGYGYANVSKEEKNKMSKEAEDYLEQTKNLKLIILVYMILTCHKQ